MPGQSFDRVAAIYDETRGGQRRGDSFARAIAPWIVAGDNAHHRVIEVGVGTGLVAAGLRTLGRDVVGFDLSEAMLRTAVDRLGSCVTLADADALPLGDGSVDTVIFVWVLQLVADPHDTLAEASRVLRPGGRVIAVLSTPDNHPDDEIGSIVSGLATLLRPGRDAAAIEAASPDGLRQEHRGFTPWEPFTDTVRAQIELIEGRGYSSLFDVDDDTWAAVVEPVVDRLRSLSDLDRPRQRRTRHPLLVWTTVP